MKRRLKGDDAYYEPQVLDYFISGSPHAMDALGASEFADVKCVRCGSAITHVFMTQYGPMGGDCLATLTGDDSTRKEIRKVIDNLKKSKLSVEHYGGKIKAIILRPSALRKKEENLSVWTRALFFDTGRESERFVASGKKVLGLIAAVTHWADGYQIPVESEGDVHPIVPRAKPNPSVEEDQLKDWVDQFERGITVYGDLEQKAQEVKSILERYRAAEASGVEEEKKTAIEQLRDAEYTTMIGIGARLKYGARRIFPHAWSMFTALLQQRSLPPALRKKVEKALQVWSRTKVRSFRAVGSDIAGRMEAQVSAYLDKIGSLREQLGTAREALALVPGQEKPRTDIVEAYPFVLVNSGGFSEAFMKSTADAMGQASVLMERKGLGFACYGNVYVVKQVSSRGTVQAQYMPSTDTFQVRGFIRTPRETNRYVQTIVHELGHRLIDKFMTSETKRLMTSLFRRKEREKLFGKYDYELPSIGETIVDRGQVFEVTGVKSNKIELRRQGEEHSRYSMTPLAWAGKKADTTGEVSSTGFVTKYASTNEEENFSEMLRFYCVDELPPEQTNVFEPVVDAVRKDGITAHRNPAMDQHKAVFTGWTCRSGPADFVEWLISHGTEVSYREFSKNVDVKSFASEGIKGLAKDPTVTFLKSSLPSGKEAWVLQWSGIEHVATSDGELDEDERWSAVRLVNNPKGMPIVWEEDTKLVLALGGREEMDRQFERMIGVNDHFDRATYRWVIRTASWLVPLEVIQKTGLVPMEREPSRWFFQKNPIESRQRISFAVAIHDRKLGEEPHVYLFDKLSDALKYVITKEAEYNNSGSSNRVVIHVVRYTREKKNAPKHRRGLHDKRYLLSHIREEGHREWQQKVFLAREDLPSELVGYEPMQPNEPKQNPDSGDTRLRAIFEEEREAFARMFPEVLKVKLVLTDRHFLSEEERTDRDLAWYDERRIYVLKAAGNRSDAVIRGLMRHELGHAVDKDLKKPGAERRADRLAKKATGVPIRYTKDGLQNATHGIKRRPKWLHQ